MKRAGYQLRTDKLRNGCELTLNYKHWIVLRHWPTCGELYICWELFEEIIYVLKNFWLYLRGNGAPGRARVGDMFRLGQEILKKFPETEITLKNSPQKIFLKLNSKLTPEFGTRIRGEARILGRIFAWRISWIEKFLFFVTPPSKFGIFSWKIQ